MAVLFAQRWDHPDFDVEGFPVGSYVEVKMGWTCGVSMLSVGVYWM